MDLKPKMEVRLVPWIQASNEHPFLMPAMEPFFGRTVTINTVDSNGLFTIKEDSGEHIYHTRWIQSTNLVPDELFEI